MSSYTRFFFIDENCELWAKTDLVHKLKFSVDLGDTISSKKKKLLWNGKTTFPEVKYSKVENVPHVKCILSFYNEKTILLLLTQDNRLLLIKQSYKKYLDVPSIKLITREDEFLVSVLSEDDTLYLLRFENEKISKVEVARKVSFYSASSFGPKYYIIKHNGKVKYYHHSTNEREVLGTLQNVKILTDGLIVTNDSLYQINDKTKTLTKITTPTKFVDVTYAGFEDIIAIDSNFNLWYKNETKINFKRMNLGISFCKILHSGFDIVLLDLEGNIHKIKHFNSNFVPVEVQFPKQIYFPGVCSVRSAKSCT